MTEREHSPSPLVESLCPFCDGEGASIDGTRCLRCDGWGHLKAPPPTAVVSRYTFVPDPRDPLNTVDVELTRWDQDQWAVRCRGRCLTTTGWEFEPQPSSRDDEFYARARWDKDEAIRRAREAVAEGNVP